MTQRYKLILLYTYFLVDILVFTVNLYTFEITIYTPSKIIIISDARYKRCI